MDTEEKAAIKSLLASDSTVAEQKRSLQRISETLEECYILNLPASKDTLAALNTFSKRAKADSALKTKAKRLFSKYKI